MNASCHSLPLQQKPNDGPPDLDEMWRDFNRRLTELFGHKKNGSGGQKPRTDGGNGNGKGRRRIGMVIIIGTLIAAWAGNGAFAVQDGQQGVVLWLGQYWHTVGPGVHWNPPWPLGAHHLVNVAQSHTLEVDSSASVPAANATGGSVITRGGDVFNVRMSVQYHVKQPTDYLFRNARPDEVVMQAAQAALRSVAGAHSTADLLAQGQASGQASLDTQIASVIQHSLDLNQTGLSVTSVTIQRVAPPAAVQATRPDTATGTEQQASQNAQEASAPGGANAQTDAQMIADAQAYSARVIAQAQADAEHFTLMDAQYVKAPYEVRERIYAQTMQQIYANTTKVLVDSQSGKIELPLNEIVNATRPHAASATPDASGASGTTGMPGTSGMSITAPEAIGANAASAASPATNSAPFTLRSRDLLRSRTRETDSP